MSHLPRTVPRVVASTRLSCAGVPRPGAEWRRRPCRPAVPSCGARWRAHRAPAAGPRAARPRTRPSRHPPHSHRRCARSGPATPLCPCAPPRSRPSMLFTYNIGPTTGKCRGGGTVYSSGRRRRVLPPRRETPAVRSGIRTPMHKRPSQGHSPNPSDSLYFDVSTAPLRTSSPIRVWPGWGRPRRPGVPCRPC